MTAWSDARARLAAALGIAPVWHDMSGREHHPGPETQAALLAAMGVAAQTPAEAEAALAAHEAAQGARTLPHEVVLRPGEGWMARLSGEWRLTLDDGRTREGRAERFLRLDPPQGLHVLECGEQRCLVIVAPPRAPTVADLTGRDRVWGATTAIWALRSARPTTGSALTAPPAASRWTPPISRPTSFRASRPTPRRRR
jgi:hypothetical protein